MLAALNVSLHAHFILAVLDVRSFVSQCLLPTISKKQLEARNNQRSRYKTPACFNNQHNCFPKYNLSKTFCFCFIIAFLCITIFDAVLKSFMIEIGKTLVHLLHFE